LSAHYAIISSSLLTYHLLKPARVAVVLAVAIILSPLSLDRIALHRHTCGLLLLLLLPLIHLVVAACPFLTTPCAVYCFFLLSKAATTTSHRTALTSLYYRYRYRYTSYPLSHTQPHPCTSKSPTHDDQYTISKENLQVDRRDSFSSSSLSHMSMQDGKN
jgi:hypothetical protein